MMRSLSDRRKLFRYAFGLLVTCLCIQPGTAQLFPGLEGEQLVEAIRNDFTPGQLLNDTQVKDTLYAKVFSIEDSVRCIYSGLSRYLPEGVDPSQWLFGTGLEVESINLEHSWPQAKGAGEGTDGNMNMYHLFPSRAGINSDRANLPYADINDAQTQKWYFRNIEMTTKPVSNIDAYSEFGNGAFEPRESVKGDIARGMFYFWTIYRADAMAADPFFFDLQRDRLCQWHEQDPVDAEELLRNEIIAHYQDGKRNPFILDCSLVMRAYCSQLPECPVVSSGVLPKEDNTILYLPGSYQFMITGQPNQIWQLHIFDILGRDIHFLSMYSQQPGEAIFLPSGFYFAVATQGRHEINTRINIP
jgi:endonuclease I